MSAAPTHQRQSRLVHAAANPRIPETATRFPLLEHTFVVQIQARWMLGEIDIEGGARKCRSKNDCQLTEEHKTGPLNAAISTAAHPSKLTSHCAEKLMTEFRDTRHSMHGAFCPTFLSLFLLPD